MFARVVVVQDRIGAFNFAAVLLEPLWARSTHKIAFGLVTLCRLEHCVLLRAIPPDAQAALRLIVNALNPAERN